MARLPYKIDPAIANARPPKWAALDLLRDQIVRQIVDTSLTTGRPVDVHTGGRPLFTLYPDGRIVEHRD